jgi:hypothetical protein
VSEVIDTIPDIDGDLIEVIFGCGREELPVLRVGGALVILDDAGAERFGRAWNEALLMRERAKANAASGMNKVERLARDLIGIPDGL